MAHTAPTHQATTNHTRLQAWVDEVAALTQPDDIYWCDGSAEGYDRLAQQLVDAGTFERLSDSKRPNSYLALSDPDDVARSRTGRSSARSPRTMPARRTTGASRRRCAGRSASCSRARCGAARC